jgi:hypothetical protein
VEFVAEKVALGQPFLLLTVIVPKHSLAKTNNNNNNFISVPTQ